MDNLTSQENTILYNLILDKINKINDVIHFLSDNKLIKENEKFKQVLITIKSKIK